MKDGLPFGYVEIGDIRHGLSGPCVDMVLRPGWP